MQFPCRHFVLEFLIGMFLASTFSSGLIVRLIEADSCTRAAGYAASSALAWNKTYGGAGSDFALALVQTVDGGYALAGRTYSFGSGSSDIWLIRTDTFGNHLWNKTYGGTRDDRTSSLVHTADGGYALAGTTYSFGAGSSDIWLVKTDALGNHLWNKTYGGTREDDPAHFLVQTVDGGYALAGRTYSFGSGSSDVWLVRTDAFGNHLWNRTYGGTNVDGVFALVQTVDGGYALAGHTYSFGAGSSDAWLIKISADGNHEWNETYGGMDEDYACRLVPTGDDGYVLAGSAKSFGAGNDDFWLVKTVRDVPTIIVPDDYPTIQEAINNAAEGDTVFVKAGTYYEHVIVSKSLTLLGEGREVTTIDGSMTGNVVRVTKDYVNITGFTIRRGGHAYTNSGIYVGSTRHCDISANYIVDSDDGVFGSPRDMSVTDNIIEGNFLGVALDSGATNNVIFRNHLVANYVGVHLNLADANFIVQNNMTNNQRSVTLWDSSNNRVYHNNFLNDTFGSTTYANFLDNGLEGNYWSNYTGVDLNQDGIGDSPYVVDANNTDHYPLMGMFNSCNTSHGYTVDFVSNSSILNAGFNLSPIRVYPPEAILSFNISGETGTGGFLRVCIPKNLINGSYVVRFDDEVITNTTYPRVRELPCSNETYTYFYINYTHSEHTITITGTSACAHKPVVVPDDYATIQEAINNAIDGDTIYVKSGVYCEHVVVNKTVSLLGEDVSMTIVDGSGSGNVFAINKNNVTITGFTIRNSGTTLGNAGLRLDNVSFCSISGNSIQDNFAGIWLEESSDNLVVANDITSNADDGIVFNYSHNNAISGNHIAFHEYFGIVINWSHNNTICYNNVTQTFGPSHGDGINLWRSSSNNIFQNRVEDNTRYGIRIETQSNNNTLSENTIRNCTTGLQVYDSSSDSSIIGNSITGNTLTGVSVERYSDNNTISGNTITGGRFGVSISNSRYTVICDNTIAQTYGSDIEAGVYLESAGYTKIYENEIIDNWRSILVYASSPHVSVHGNNITNNEHGIAVARGGSNYFNISENYVANNRAYGIALTGLGGASNYATVARNLIVNNTLEGVGIGQGSSYNMVIQNNIVGNGYGIYIDLFGPSTENTIFNNNIINNTQQIRIAPGSVNAWNGSYASGGNYWSDYSGLDQFSGPYQNVTGSDQIGDNPYVIDAVNMDNYPLVNPWAPQGLVADINDDGTVNILDIFTVARAFSSKPGDARWNADADLNNDEIVDILDIFLVARDFGKTV